MNWLYTFTPPLGSAVKFGITGNIRGRLGKYQLPYGPVWEASYSWLCSHPDAKTIGWLEDSIMGHFRFNRWGIGAGMTEWLEGVTVQEIRDHVMAVSGELNLGVTDHGLGPWTQLRLSDTFSEP